MCKLLFFTVIFTFSTTVYSACKAPTPPLIPNIETTVTAEMVKTQNDIREFMSKAEKFLKCTKNSARHNEMVDTMKDLGDEFNRAIRAYKMRMANA